MLKASRSTQLASLFAYSCLGFVGLDSLFSRPSFATLTVTVPTAQFPQLFTDGGLGDQCPGINLVCFATKQPNLPHKYALNSLLGNPLAEVKYVPFNGGNTASLTLTKIQLTSQNSLSNSVPFQFGINFDSGIFPAVSGPLQMTVSLSGSVKTVNNVPFTHQLKLTGLGSVGPSFTQVAKADATFGTLGGSDISPHQFAAIKVGTFYGPITSFYGNFEAVFLQPFDQLTLPDSLSIVLSKAQPPNFFFVPPGAQEDFDPILDIIAAPGDILPFNVVLDASGVSLPPKTFSNILVEWDYNWDPNELALLNNTNPSPTTIIDLSGGLLSTITFEALIPGLHPHDGISDFGITLKKVLYQGPMGDFDATNQFPAPSLNIFNLPGNAYNQVVEVQRTIVPSPLPLLGIATAFGYSRKLRKRIKSSSTSECMCAIN